MADIDQNNFISKLYSEYYDSIVKYCSAMLDDEYEDAELCAQEVFEQAYKDEKKLMQHPNIVGWLKKTALHRVKRFLRNKSKRIKTEVHITDLSERYMESLQYLQDFDNTFVQDKDIAAMKDTILNQLSEDDRKLYTLRFIDKLTYKELAPHIGLSESAARMRTVRLELHIKELVSKMFE